MCIASACMAWRWEAGGIEEEVHYVDEPPGAEWVATGPAWDADPNKLLKLLGGAILQRFRRTGAGLGFCGLAGVPR